MGLYLTAGHTYSDTAPNNTVNGANLNEHVNNAVFETTCISSQTLKDPAALSDEVLINDGGSFKKVTMQQLYELFIQPGAIIQTVSTTYSANTNLTASLPVDDTVPQNTEGTEILNLSITPRFSTSLIRVSFVGQVAPNAAANMAAALFRDATASAISATVVHADAANVTRILSLSHLDSPATTSAVAYKIRAGAPSATIRFNGTSAARFFGGASAASLILQEIKQ